jgi:hypothetical protein
MTVHCYPDLIDLLLITVSQGAGFPVRGYLNPSSKPLSSALQANGRQFRSRREID